MQFVTDALTIGVLPEVGDFSDERQILAARTGLDEDAVANSHHVSVIVFDRREAAVEDGGSIHLGTTPQRLTSTPIHSTHSGGGGGGGGPIDLGTIPRRLTPTPIHSTHSGGGRGTHPPGDNTTTAHINSHPLYTQRGGGEEEGDPSTWGPYHDDSHQLPSNLHTAGGGGGGGGPIDLGTTPRRLTPTLIHSTHSGRGRGTHPPGDHTTTANTNSHPLYTQRWRTGDPSTWGPHHDGSHQLPSTLHTAVEDGGPIHLGTTPRRLIPTPIHSTHSGGGGGGPIHLGTTPRRLTPTLIHSTHSRGGGGRGPTTWGPHHDGSHQLPSTLHTAVEDGGPIHLGTTPRRLIPTPIHSTHSGGGRGTHPPGDHTTTANTNSHPLYTQRWGGRGTHPPGDHTTTTHTNSHPLYTQQGGGGTGPNHLGTTPRRLTPTPIHSTHSGGGRGTHPPGDHTTTANTNSHPLYTQRWGTGDPSTWGPHHDGSHQPPSTLHTASVQSPTHHTATLQSPSPV